MEGNVGGYSYLTALALLVLIVVQLSVIIRWMRLIREILVLIHATSLIKDQRAGNAPDEFNQLNGLWENRNPFPSPDPRRFPGGPFSTSTER